MCDYCNKKATNKAIKDIDNDKEDKARVVFLDNTSWLNVELDGEDSDGYKPEDFFQINYCPMCRQKVR